METGNQFQDSTVRAPLFPAYSIQTEENEATQIGSKDWLCNSSYTPNSYKETFIKEKEVSGQEVHYGKSEVVEKSKSKKSKKRKDHIKKHHIPTPESFHVPESDSVRSQLNKKTFIEETGLSFERAFRVDRSRDSENIYYDCLEQTKIAKYRLYPKVPIGCSLQEQSLWSQSSTHNSKTDVPRYFSKKILKQFMKLANEVEACLPCESEFSGVTLNFIPLPPSGSQLANSIRDELRENFDGVSTSWKSAIEKGPGIEVKVSADESKLDAAFDSELRNKIALFNRKVSDSPHDIQLWLDFVDFQDELYNLQKSGEANKSLPESYLIEKKVSILDKALKHNQKNVQLNVAKLNFCRHLWKIDKVISSWDQLIFLNPNNAHVWKEYIIFVLTNLTYFSTPRVLKVFAKCIRTLSNLSEGIIKSHVAPPDIMDSMLDVFGQLCFVLKSCGYMEKAIAAFQGLIEFNLFSISSATSASVSELISCFEPFWDSGAPRFGEDSAVGWAETVEENKISFNKIVTQSDLSNVEDDILCQKLPEWNTWLKFERLRENHHWLPWRPNPEYDQTVDDIDDIDRTVSFDDISKFIFHVPNEEHKFLLLHNFIKLLGFNPHLFGCSNHSSKTTNNQTSIDNFDILSKKLSDTLFSEQDSNPLSFKTNTWTAEQINFIKNVFSQARGKFSSKYKILLSFLWLKYQQVALAYDNNTENIASVKKFAKNMLQEAQNRNCLLLWSEYIRLESDSGSRGRAKKTAETLFASSSSAVASGTMPVKELWHFVQSYIDLSLGIQENCVPNSELFSRSDIIWLLIHMGSREKYVPYSNELIKPTLILKSSSGFRCLLNQELSSLANLNCELCYCLDPCAYSIIDCMKCFSYLQYFTQGIDAAIQVPEELTKLMNDKVVDSYKSYVMEEMCVFQAQLLNFHTRNSTVSMKPLMLYLYDSVKQFPNNARLLLLLVRWRNASSVVSPTRRFFASILKDPSKTLPITWIFALASELSISYALSDQSNLSTDMQLSETSPSTTGIKWKIRSLYEKALNSVSCAYIPILWRSYMKFEMLNKEVEKCKSIFHRALQNCGWSKELVMDGIEYFPDDLKQIIDFMVEKQIRVHTPLEEINLLMEHGTQNM